MATQTRLKASGLQWLASRDPDRWAHRGGKRDGKAHITRIAADAAVDRTSLQEMLSGRREPNTGHQNRLRDLAVSTGVSHDRAHSELFEFVEVDGMRVAA